MSSRKLLLGLALKYPVQIIINIILGFTGGIFNGVSTALIVPVLLNLVGQEQVLKSGPPLLVKILSPFNSLPEQYRLYAMAGTIVLLIGLKNLTGYISSLSNSVLSRAITADLQEKGLRLLLDVDLDFFTKAKSGDLMNRLGGEMSRTTASISGFISLTTTAVTILVFVGILLSVSWQLTLAATVLLPLSALLPQHLISRAKVFSKLITNINQEYSGNLIETFAGIRLVKASGTEQEEYARFKKLIREREKVDFSAKMNSAAVSPIGEITNIVVLFTLVLLSRFIFANNLDALSAILLTYIVILSRLLPLIPQLNSARQGLARSSASVEVVHDLLRTDNKPFMKNGSIPYTGFKKEIRFENVSFKYPETSELVLRGINLRIPRGTTVALVGSSGAGKSTIADLLPRFYDPIDGRITIDGIDLRDFDIRSFRKLMGIVSQETFLFNDSVRNNIAYGFAEATEEAIIDAIKRANAYEFIMNLPKGLDTLIGDRGVMLSGGQRQRLAISRALLKNPEILILDEATSALDTVSESLVQQALDELSRERTTLVIAHRLSTIQKAHQIAVMDKGKIVELGTHNELLKKGGHYSRLYATQFAHTSKKVASVVQEQKQVVSQASYEFRAHLNSMLGSLSLLADGLTDTPEEQNELAEAAYNSALELFKTVRDIESATQAISSQDEVVSKDR
jgi:ATP-binding cassette, subfamily B, bacterial MsbA